MQCKDVPDLPILEFLARHSNIVGGVDYGWCNWYLGNDRDVSKAMPEETPSKVRQRKMVQLIRRGLVDGCKCGCRGDFVLTAKGWDYLRSQESVASGK